MFSSLGIFKNVPCPYEDECQLACCLFKHDPNSNTQKPSQQVTTVGSEAQRYPKRRRLNTALDESVEVVPQKSESPVEAVVDRSAQVVQTVDPDQSKQSEKNEKKVQVKTRPISPPPIKRAQKPDTALNLPLAPAKTETLNPRKLQSSPASHSTRNLYLKNLHEKLQNMNSKLASLNEEDAKSLVLSEQQVISLALDEEERAAVENPSIYANVIKNRLLSLSKMKVEQWQNERRQHENSKKRTSKRGEVKIDTGLETFQEVQVLKHLITKDKTLKKYDFVMSVPGEEQVAKAKEGIATAKGLEQCDRCKSRFQVLSHLTSEDGLLTSGGSCTYHPGRLEFLKLQGGEYKMFNCCNAALGTSSGCITADSHVFKVEDPARLAAVWQYECTPNNETDFRKAVSFDCEMGYTTNGMELIRLTVLSWPEGDLLLDVLVKPFGAIIDLNSRFSGVQHKDFESALPYGNSDDDKSEQKDMRVVESPEKARQLFFGLISESTILVGHSLENDLNAARIVHPNIVDSTVLFPHPRGPPYRLGLKRLAKEALNRNVQMGVQGHDPQEDAKTAGDLVRIKVAQRWKQLEIDGWTFEGEELVSPKERMERSKENHTT